MGVVGNAGEDDGDGGGGNDDGSNDVWNYLAEGLGEGR